MTANQHPYPAHIVEALADAAFPHDLDGIERANHALAALWDASRVDTLDEVDDLPSGSAVVDKDNWVWKQFDAEHDLHEDDLPAHVIYWGNHDR